jgi:hypothetical protein
MGYPWLQPEQLDLAQPPQELPEEGRKEPPLTEAKTLIARSTLALPHSGQTTFSDELKISSSKSCWHLLQIYS